MGRKKINIREIENSRQKTVTFARRRAGLIKKAHELSILCGVKVAIVMFDSKNASHVYSSSDTPEELFARYLNKQFLTNESRKRKDQGDNGVFGFDNGSFVRRRLAVVNQYKVTSDGPSSENLQVKYTKQYHNPAQNGTVDYLHEGALPDQRLPARSISLLKRTSAVPHNPTLSSPTADHTNNENVVLATRDFSSMSLLPDRALLAPGDYTRYQEPSDCVENILRMITPCSTVTSGCQPSGEPLAKRPRSQSFANTASDLEKCKLDKSLVEQFLANANVAQLLQAQWLEKPESSDCSNEYDDDDDDDGSDNGDEEIDDTSDDNEGDYEEHSTDDPHTGNGAASQNGAKCDGAPPAGQSAHDLQSALAADSFASFTTSASSTDLSSATLGALQMGQGQNIQQPLQFQAFAEKPMERYIFYPDGGVQALTQLPQAKPPGQASLSSVQQYPQLALPTVSTPFELAALASDPNANLMDGRHSLMVPSHNSSPFRLHPDMVIYH
ncbi:hypothetical protein GGI25_005580 [Coemansia spiralis]|uniref:MADS-box domain-containing protein n=1 Tax=Coemansia spiralis TaxID=417178 RepID=A0A9W8G2E5_9FUNG|nr:hypothetical protein GGI25_005580 [Coemansia spiralis]